MMVSSSDPLLPRTNPTPEVRGSQPRRLNNVGDINRDASNIRSDGYEEKSASRRVLSFAGVAILLFLVLSLLPDGVLTGWLPHKQHPPHTINGRVALILQDTPLIDGHNDLAILIAAYFGNHINNETFLDQFEYGGMPAHVDLPRLAEGQNGGAFWSAFVPCPAKGMDFSDENYADCELVFFVAPFTC